MSAKFRKKMDNKKDTKSSLKIALCINNIHIKYPILLKKVKKSLLAKIISKGIWLVFLAKQIP
jgi:hypothetical protein